MVVDEPKFEEGQGGMDPDGGGDGGGAVVSPRQDSLKGEQHPILRPEKCVSSLGGELGGDTKAEMEVAPAKVSAQSLNPLVLPSGEVRRLKKTSCPRGNTPPVLIRNPETPFFDPYNHECPQTDNTVHNSTVDYGGWTSLHAAAASKTAGTHDKMRPCKGDVDQVRFLLNGRGHHVPATVSMPHYSSPLISVDAREVRRGFTPLHVAVTARHPDVVAALVKGKASVDSRDCMGRTALHWACELDEYESMSHMLQREGGGGAAHLGKMTVIVGAVTGLSIAGKEVGEMLNLFVEVTISHRDPRDPPPPIQPKIGRRIDDGTQHRTQRTAPVRTAVKGGEQDIDFSSAQVVFRNSPTDVTIRVRIIAQDMSWAEIQVAEWYGQSEQLGETAKRVPLVPGGKLVLKTSYVRVIDTVDDNGVTPLHLAASAGSKRSAVLLLEAGARTDIKDGFGGGVAMYAATAGHGEVCRLIEDKGGVW